MEFEESTNRIGKPLLVDFLLFKMLKDKKVADAYQFYRSCAYKIYFAETSFQALENVINKYQIDETERVNKVFSEAMEKGVGKYIA